MRRQPHQPFILALESRCLLAGNVTFQFTGGTLRLTGDNSANEISVSQGVDGLQIRALNGTRLDGVVNGFRAIANPSLIEINMQGGDDTLHLQGYLGGIVAGLMGSGNDVVRMTSVVNSGAMLFDLGTGNDFWTTFYTADRPNQIGGNLTVRGNSGNDSIGLQKVLVNGEMTLDGAIGVDEIAVFDGIVEGNATVDLGSSNDYMLILRSTFRSASSILGNSGNDLMGIQSSRFVGSTTVNLSSGNDSLVMDENQFTGNLSRIGGSGADLAYQFHDILGGTSTNSGIETLLTTTSPRVEDLYRQLFLRFD